MSNEITVKGIVGSDPELRYTGDGVAVASFRLADSTQRFNQDTKSWEQVGETIWWNVSVWQKLGEGVAEKVSKGNFVEVKGNVSFRTYETKDKETRTVYELRANNVSLPVTQKKDGGNNGGGNAARGYGGGNSGGNSAPANNDETPF